MEVRMSKRLFPRSGKGEAAAVPAHPRPDDDGVSRANPGALRDRPPGDVLRTIGASPDDPTNIMPTPESVQAHIEEMRTQREEFLAAINSEMPNSVTLVPWAMLPGKIWSGPHGNFLAVGCGMYPVGPWNTMLLPDDDEGARFLKLPKHLGGFPPDLEAAINDLIGDLRENFAAVHEHTGAAMARADAAALDEFEAARNEARAKLGGLARIMGVTVYGEDACERHRELFGKALGWV
jgi:hypothetical protein